MTSELTLTDNRPELVRLQIVQLRDNIVDSFITLARLLKEARDKNYANGWGYARFSDWVEQGSGLDLSSRNAYYLINVVEGGDRLGIPDEELKQVKFSSLKEIFSLPKDTDPDKLRELIREAKTLAYKDVRDVVGAIKNDAYVYHTIKLAQDTEDNVYQPTLERVRREYGDTVGPDGSPEDITDSRAIEMVLANYLSTPDEQAYTVINAEWADVGDSHTEEAEENPVTVS